MSEGHYENIARHLKSNCSTIEYLNVRGIWFREKSLAMFVEALRRMPKLQQLYVPYIADDHMVETVARKCAHLKVLDTSGCVEVTEDGLKALRGLSGSLQVVNLGGQGGSDLEPEYIAMLINSLPKLVSLGGYPWTGEAVHILASKLGRTHPTKLKYLHERNLSAEVLQSLQLLCPGKKVRT